MKLTNLLAVLCLILLVALFSPFNYGNDKESVKGSACLSTVKRQALGLLQYTADHDARYPFRDAWMDATRPYVPSYSGEPPGASERCASIFRSGGYGYAFNSRLARAKMPRLPRRSHWSTTRAIPSATPAIRSPASLRKGGIGARTPLATRTATRSG